MTLGTGLVVLGLGRLPAGGPQRRHRAPRRDHLAQWGLDIGFLPNSLLRVHPDRGSHPVACATRDSVGCCSRSAITRSPRGSAGARIWQVLVALYALSAMLAAVAGPPGRRARQHRDGLARRGLGAAVGRGGGHRWDIDHVAAAAATAGTIVGAPSSGPDRAPDRLSPEAGREDAVQASSSSPWRPAHAGDRRVVSRHLGVDLGVTNPKWPCSRRPTDPRSWTTLDCGQVPTRATDGPRCRHRADRRDGRVGGRALA